MSAGSLTRRFVRKPCAAPSIRVVSFNMLAPGMARPEDFDTITPAELHWDVRGPRVVEEIFRHDPDVVCLQECNKKVFTAFLLPQFSLRGFTGVPGPYKGEAGYGLFYRQDMFELVKGPERCKLHDPESVRDCGALALLFSKRDQRFLVLGSLHLEGKQSLDHIRARQVSLALDQATALSTEAVVMMSAGWSLKRAARARQAAAVAAAAEAAAQRLARLERKRERREQRGSPSLGSASPTDSASVSPRSGGSSTPDSGLDTALPRELMLERLGAVFASADPPPLSPPPPTAAAAAAVEEEDEDDPVVPVHAPGICLCADMNDRQDSLAYAAALSHPADVHSAYARVLGHEPPVSYLRHRPPPGMRGMAIDFVLAGGGLEAVGALTIEAGPDEVFPELPSPQHPSDHVSLVTELAWRAHS
jgi:hypothetical protein